MLDRRALGEGFVDDLLEVNLRTATVRRVLSDNGDACGVVDAVDDGMCGKTAEDDRVHRADAGAGEQSDRKLGAHAHVDGDTIALLDAEALQHVGEALYLRMQVAIGELTNLTRLALPEQCNLVAARTVGVAVDAVVRKVQLAAGEPFGSEGGAIAARGEHLAPGGEPIEFAGCFSPELLGLLDAAAVHLFVLLDAGDMSLGAELLCGFKDPVLPQTRVQIRRSFVNRRQRNILPDFWVPPKGTLWLTGPATEG